MQQKVSSNIEDAFCFYLSFNVFDPCTGNQYSLLFLHPEDADAIVDRVLNIYDGILAKWMPVIATLVGVFIGQRLNNGEELK